MAYSLWFVVKIHYMNFCYLLENFVKQNFTLNYQLQTTNYKHKSFVF